MKDTFLHSESEQIWGWKNHLPFGFQNTVLTMSEHFNVLNSFYGFIMLKCSCHTFRHSLLLAGFMYSCITDCQWEESVCSKQCRCWSVQGNSFVWRSAFRLFSNKALQTRWQIIVCWSHHVDFAFSFTVLKWDWLTSTFFNCHLIVWLGLPIAPCKALTSYFNTFVYITNLLCCTECK